MQFILYGFYFITCHFFEKNPLTVELFVITTWTKHQLADKTLMITISGINRIIPAIPPDLPTQK
jgi:hypothetical protein